MPNNTLPSTVPSREISNASCSAPLSGSLSWPAITRRVSPLLMLMQCVVVAASSGCAGYQVGARSLFRPDVQTVFVPVFESDSFRRQLGERLTEAVVKQIELQTPYKVVARPDADTVLTGRIVSEQKRIIAEDINDVPRDIETDLVVQITWYDRRGEMLINNMTLPVPPVSFSAAATTNFIPEAGQSVATAHQEAIRELASQIVSQMELPW